uniref:Leucokinin n=1 Tax=Anopheles dirus TaxID=7168 RepID=A0A182NQT5_9DIPT
MAVFCVLLATAAFVLTVGPQVCRCDRSGSQGVYNGNIWASIIGPEGDHDEDGFNLIPATKLIHDSAPSLSWSGPPGANPRDLMLLEALINRYRKYMVEKIAHFDDACSFLYGAENEQDNEEPSLTAVESRSEISPDRATDGPVGDGGIGRSSPGISGVSNRLQKDASLSEPMKLPEALSDDCLRNAKQYYRCLLERFDDRQLVGMLDDYLEAHCFHRDSYGRNAALQKRDTPRYVSKQKFHSWGGKRNTAQVFYPWGGKRTVPRPHKQPKVVIRNPFHSWGGKRNGLPVDTTV